jgi:hypothetical protein
MGWFISTPELDGALAEYKKVFRDYYPLSYLHHPGDPEYHIQRIKDCIASGEPIPLSEYEEFRERVKRDGICL